MPARLILLLPHGLCLIAVAWLLMITPTLNADDLQIAEWAPAALSEGWGRTLGTVLFNMDLGVTQLRTYGLARAIQYLQIGLAGVDSKTAYGFIIALHFASGALVYRIANRIGGDALTGVFAAITWMASPAVLPLLKVQHHFLYLIAPYYPLLGWVLLSAARQQSAKVFVAGAFLLTVAWLLGEGVVVPIVVAVVTIALFSGTWRRAIPLLGQGAVAGFLLFLHLGYQHLYIRDPGIPQRFNMAPDVSLVYSFLRQLWQNGLGVMGLPHEDAELGTMLGGVGVFGAPMFWAVLVVLLAFGAAAIRFLPRSPLPHDRRLALTVALISVASLGVYLLFTVAGVGVFATRYAAAFFALMPVAVIAALSAYAPRTARLSAAIIAAVSLSLSLTLLYRAEILVSDPNRALLKALQGRVVVLRPDSKFDLNPAMFGATSGLVPISRNGMADPMRFLWTSELALRQYAGAPLGNTCRLVAHDKAELFLLTQSRGVYPLKDFVVEGSPSTPVQACQSK